MKNRIEWVDTIKAIGMFLVFYGHYAEVISSINGKESFAEIQFKFIYSFHMPLFFMVSGFFSKKQSNKLKYLKKLLLSRVIPVFGFAFLLLPLWLIATILFKDIITFKEIMMRCLNYIRGYPNLNWITWFLVCLFTAEAICLIFGFMRKTKVINLIIGLSLLVLGYFFTEKITKTSHLSSVILNFWFLSESLIALGFYLIGNWLFPVLIKIKKDKNWLFYLFIPISLILMSLIKNDVGLNMAILKHGDFLPFISESFLGAILIISIGMIIPSNKTMNFVGSNTIILLGLNGIFFHFLNGHIANLTFIDDSLWFTTLNCTIVSFFSIILCYPFITLINKYSPQFFGKPFQDGPIFKPLNEYFEISKKSP